MDLASTSGQDDDDWELCNNDGFVFKRKKRRIDSDAAAAEDEAALKQRRDRKMRTLLKLKDKYQKEIDGWENLSSTLRAMEERASRLRREQEQEREQTALLASSSPATDGTVSGGGSLVDELLLKVIGLYYCNLIAYRVIARKWENGKLGLRDCSNRS